MAQYNAYNFERFEPKTASKTSTAPKYEPQSQNRPQIRLVEKPKKSASQLRAQSRADAVKLFKITVIALALFAVFAFAIYSRVQLDEINRDISAVENEIKLLNDDAIKLTNELNSVVSIDKVEDYAANVLGMVKIQDYQVVYVDRSDGDSVVVADGKKTDASAVINDSGE
ncbi:MAG: hypothetical protein J1F23_04885 [Oscillospiraceae bacterium]|nr:hypothetical protein [Oscillospiraceae bacterium]